MIKVRVPKKYSHIDFTVTSAMKEEAQRGLDWRKEHDRGGTEVGVGTARAIVSNDRLSPEKWRHISHYFPRHEVDKEAEGFSPGEEGYPSAGRIAWALWGGEPGKSRSNSIVSQMDTADENERGLMDIGKLQEYLEAFVGWLRGQQQDDVGFEQQQLTPTRTRTKIVREADGTVRWLAISATSTLNRVGEIDSRRLFDSFVNRADDDNSFPAALFYHLGSWADADNPFRVGRCDWMARDGNCFLSSGIFEDNVLGRAIAGALESDPDYWGHSIGYLPTQPPEIERINDKEVPVYERGQIVEISWLPEEEAASEYTKIGGIRVDANKEKALRALLTNSEEADEILDAFKKQAESVNREIDQAGLVTRDGEEEAVEKESGEDVATEERMGGYEKREYVLDDELISTLVQTLANSEYMAKMAGEMSEMRQRMEDMIRGYKEMRKKTEARLETAERAIGDLDQRIAAVERDETAKQREWAEDMPHETAIRVTYRGRDENNETEREWTGAEQAAAVLAKLPKFGK